MSEICFKVAERVGVNVTILVEVSIFDEAAVFCHLNEYGILWVLPSFTKVCTVPFIYYGIAIFLSEW